MQSAPQAQAHSAPREEINQQAERLLNSYGNSILRYAYTYLHNREDAEEILQETLIRFLQTKPVFANDQHEKAWLLRVAANLSKNKLRAEKIRQTDELNEELAAEQRQDLAFVWEAVSRRCTCFITRAMPRVKLRRSLAATKSPCGLTCSAAVKSCEKY